VRHRWFRWTSNIVIREAPTSEIPSPQALIDPNNTPALGDTFGFFGRYVIVHSNVVVS